MKKYIALALAFVLTAVLAIGGTLAYLTDRDSKVNTFTMGDVKIELNEVFSETALVPGVDIEKKPTITNAGNNDAWVWAEIAIPAALDTPSDASKNIIHFNMTRDSVADGLWNWWDGGDAYMVTEKTIDGMKYNVYTVQYETALKPGESTTHPVICKVYLDTHVDVDPEGNLAWVEGGEVTPIEWNYKENVPQIIVSAYAIQADGFNSVYDAYDAYQTQWGDNGSEPKPDTSANP